MIVYQAHYPKNPNRADRLTVELDEADYLKLRATWNVAADYPLYVSLVVGEKGIYLQHSTAHLGFRVTNSGGRQRWRVEFRADTYKNLPHLPHFGVSPSEAAITTLGDRATVLDVKMPREPKALEPYKPRKPRTKRAEPAPTPPEDATFAATLTVGERQYDLQLTLGELLDLAAKYGQG